MWRLACAVAGAAAGAAACGAAAGDVAAGAVACGAAAELGAAVVCANALTERARAAIRIAVVTECLSVIVMSSRVAAQRDGAAGTGRTWSTYGLFAVPNNTFVSPQSLRPGLLYDNNNTSRRGHCDAGELGHHNAE